MTNYYLKKGAVSGGGGSTADPLTLINGLSIGTTPALTGAVRLSTNSAITIRNPTNIGDFNLVSGDVGGNITLGDVNAGQVFIKSSGTNNFFVGGYQWLQSGTSSSDFLTLGPSPASAGTFRLSNGFSINARNHGNTADANIISVDASDIMTIGHQTYVNTVIHGASVYLDSAQILFRNYGGAVNYGFLGGGASDFLAFGSNAPSTGAIRLANSLGIKIRDVGNTTDIPIMFSDASNNLIIGDMTSLAGTYVGANGPVQLRNQAGNIKIIPAFVDQASFGHAATDFVSFGGSPCATGAIRMTSKQAIMSSNASNTGNISVIATDAGDNVVVGGNSILYTASNQMLGASGINYATQRLSSMTGTGVAAGIIAQYQIPNNTLISVNAKVLGVDTASASGVANCITGDVYGNFMSYSGHATGILVGSVPTMANAAYAGTGTVYAAGLTMVATGGYQYAQVYGKGASGAIVHWSALLDIKTIS